MRAWPFTSPSPALHTNRLSGCALPLVNRYPWDSALGNCPVNVDVDADSGMYVLMSLGRQHLTDEEICYICVRPKLNVNITYQWDKLPQSLKVLCHLLIIVSSLISPFDLIKLLGAGFS